MRRTEFPGLEAFHREIKKQQAKAHGQHYTDNHEALARYGKECRVIKELGVSQGGTLAALIRTNPQKLTGVDTDLSRFNPYREYFTKYAEQHDIDFKYIMASSLAPRTATACDLLHIDSRHTAPHLRQELELHGPKVRKYIICHDTVSIPELLTTLKAWAIGAGWEIIEHHDLNVGYTVIGR
jgi:hypothetical protein